MFSGVWRWGVMPHLPLHDRVVRLVPNGEVGTGPSNTIKVPSRKLSCRREVAWGNGRMDLGIIRSNIVKDKHRRVKRKPSMDKKKVIAQGGPQRCPSQLQPRPDRRQRLA